VCIQQSVGSTEDGLAKNYWPRTRRTPARFQHPTPPTSLHAFHRFQPPHPVPGTLPSPLHPLLSYKQACVTQINAALTTPTRSPRLDSANNALIFCRRGLHADQLFDVVPEGISNHSISSISGQPVGHQSSHSVR